MDFDVALLDIEGTTTPIDFVLRLFAYARDHLAEFLAAHADEPAVQADLVALSQQAERDVAAGLAGATTFAPDDLDAVARNVEWQMDSDRKATALKSLQGKIWNAGYEDGTLEADVFEDVPEVLRTLNQRGVRTCIYSSGSIAAQRLLFGHTQVGDLTPLLDGYYDTTTGPKKQAESYRLIAEDLGIPVERVFFATDNLEEAKAARQAGMHTALLARPGNADLPPHDIEVWENLLPLVAD